jgi:hypothetical protein
MRSTMTARASLFSTLLMAGAGLPAVALAQASGPARALPPAAPRTAPVRLAPPQIYEVAPTRELRGLSLSLVVSGGRRFGDGYKLFDRSEGEGGAAGEVTQDLTSLGRSGQLAVGAGIQGESYQTPSGGLLVGELNTTGVYAIANARFRAAATWQPYVALAAGVEKGSLQLNPNPGGQEINAEALGAFGRASLGLRFAPRRLTVKTQTGNPIFAVAFALEVAGTAGTPLRFEYQAEPPSQGAGDSDRIPTGTVSLGSVSRQAVHGRGFVSVIF